MTRKLTGSLTGSATESRTSCARYRAKLSPYILHCAVLAVLLRGAARGVIGFSAGIGSVHTGRGVRIHAAARERFQQVGHIVRVGAGSIKIKVPGGDGMDAQETVVFVRRFCSGGFGSSIQTAARTKDAHGPFCRKSFCKPPHTIPGQQTYFQKGRTSQL